MYFASKSFRTQRSTCSFNNGARMKTFIAALIPALGVLAIGTGASVGSALALDGPGRALVASDTELQIASDPVPDRRPPGNGVGRSFIPPYSGTVRVKWEVRSGDGGQVFSSAGVAHLSDCARPTISQTFVLKACNIRVAAGVPITILASPSAGTTVTSIRRVRIFYRVVDFDGEAIIYDEAPWSRVDEARQSGGRQNMAASFISPGA